MGFFEDVVIPACLGLICMAMTTLLGFLIYRLATCGCEGLCG